jgi:hypothetical protein
LRFFESGEGDDWGVARAGRRNFGVGTTGFVGDGVCSFRGDAAEIVLSGDPSS